MQAKIYQNLLGSVYRISNEYEKIAQVTGENFNVFRILKVDRKEVRMHSSFLAELLNPSGCHGCGDVFLKMFIENQKTAFMGYAFFKKLEKFVVEKCAAKPELSIGKIEPTERKGGRIDLILRDNAGNSIIFENKIDAGDQDDQLVRYNSYDRSAPIFYLTLFGSAPTEKSKGDLEEGVDYVNISYKNDILVWLNQCKEKAVNFPMLRESINQYIYLIKHLTNKTMSDQMKNEIISQVLLTSENIEAAQIIAEAWDEVRLGILSDLKKEIVKKGGVAENLNLNVEFDKPLGLKDSGFWFYKNNWWHCVYFFFNQPYKNLLLGILTRNANDKFDDDFKM